MSGDLRSSSRWEKINTTSNLPQVSKFDMPRTIVITETKKQGQLSNEIELTDEYISKVLPIAGYRIVPPPPNYCPIKREHSTSVTNMEDSKAANLPRIPKEFQAYFTDTRPDEELTPAERQERFVMKLLLQIKDGGTWERKCGLRFLLTHAPEFGADLIFSKLIPLLSSNVLGEQERHSLVKALDRLLYRLSAQVGPHVPQLLAIMSKMLIEHDAMARNEGREIISNLAKIAGFPVILRGVRSGLSSEDKAIRAMAAQTMATAANALGISVIIPFLNACSHSSNALIRQTGTRVVNAIAFQAGSGVLPFLPQLVGVVETTLVDSEPVVAAASVKAVTALAEACAPYGGAAFSGVIPIVKAGLEQRNRRHFIRALGAILMCLEVETATKEFRDLEYRLQNEFESQSMEEKMIALTVFERALERGIVERLEPSHVSRLSQAFFNSFWNTKIQLEYKLEPHLIAVTAALGDLVSTQEIVEKLFADFKRRVPEYRVIVVKSFDKILEKNGTNTISDKWIAQICDCLIFPPIDGKDKNERANEHKIKAQNKCLEDFIASIGERVKPFLAGIGAKIQNQVSQPNHHTRREGADLLTYFAPAFGLYDRKPLKHFYSTIQELFAEEYPDVLASILNATTAIVRALSRPSAKSQSKTPKNPKNPNNSNNPNNSKNSNGHLNDQSNDQLSDQDNSESDDEEEIMIENLEPGPDEIVAKLVPILKNRNQKVSYACIELIRSFSELKKVALVNKKEWMRVCFEMLELLKADRRKVRQAAIETFATIAQNMGPFDVLLALLNNLQVQERQIRLCTTVAIAVLAEKCHAYNVLPALMNEYRTPDSNVQNGTLKALQFLFQTIGPECADYCYAVEPLLIHALIERDATHRQIACLATRNFAVGCFGAGKEDAMIDLLNHVLPNVLESTLHFIDAVMDCIDGLRLALGPGIIMSYSLSGLFHPARKVRSQFWRIYNNVLIYSGDGIVPYYPMIGNKGRNNLNSPNYPNNTNSGDNVSNYNNYELEELDVFI